MFYFYKLVGNTISRKFTIFNILEMLITTTTTKPFLAIKQAFSVSDYFHTGCRGHQFQTSMYFRSLRSICTSRYTKAILRMDTTVSTNMGMSHPVDRVRLLFSTTQFVQGASVNLRERRNNINVLLMLIYSNVEKLIIFSIFL